MPLGATITVINKSGKIVSSSKHLVNAFKEARSAYRERKAEINATREADFDEKQARRMLRAATIHDDRDDRYYRDDRDDVRSHGSRSTKHPHRSKTHRHSRPPVERGYTDTFYAAEHQPRRARSVERHTDDIQKRELVRRRTDGPGMELAYAPAKTSRSHSEPHIDMDLAYGELPPPLPVRRQAEEGELRQKMSTLTMLLDEANCLQHSVTTTIEHLQKNPDALAAVALTLAEISNLARKMAPGMLMGLRGSFPAVVALLSSPQFMIAAGVGVGVTVVALGGYKIIKRIKAQSDREMEAPLVMDELQTQELSAIEMWRRGIADAEAESVGTTVDGEFITPGASKRLVAEGVLAPPRDDRGRERQEHKTRSRAPKSSKSVKSSKTSRSKSVREKSKKKESGLRRLFRSKTP